MQRTTGPQRFRCRVWNRSITVAPRIDSPSNTSIYDRARHNPSRDSHGAVPKALSKSMGRSAVLTMVAIFAIVYGKARAQAPPNDLPNPYRIVPNWAQRPDGSKWGASAGADVA